MADLDPLDRYRWFHALWALVLTVLHVALVDYFVPLAWLGSKFPIGGVDFETHAEQTWRVIEGLEGWGKSWVYDVQLQAGFPNGTIFDADNKLWELWTYVWYRMGAMRSTGFNSFVFVAHFLILPMTYAAARLFGLRVTTALLATTLASLIWFFDSYAHWFWWIGTVAYIFAAYFYILPLALFYRFSHDRALWRLPLVAVLMALGHLLHPYTFFVMVVPMLVIYVGMFRSCRRVEHLAISGIAVVVVVCNFYWLAAAIQHWHYILNSAYYGASHPGFVLGDFFNLLIEAHTTGYIGTRASFRWVAFAASVGMLLFWKREQDPRFKLFAIGISTMLFFAYVLPVIFPAALQVQPYRFVASAMFLSVFPAAELGTRLWSVRKTATTWTRVCVAVLAIPAFQHLAGDVIYFTPLLLHEVPRVRDAPFPISPSGYGPHFSYQHVHPSTVNPVLETWIDVHAEHGRIAVPDWTGERMAWATRAQILGGFVELNLQHARAHLLRWADYKQPTTAQLREYLETYAVAYLVVRFDGFGLAGAHELVEQIDTIGGAFIYRSKLPVNFFFENSGKITARTNRIEVKDTDPSRPVVIKYHWHEALVCKPNCKVERSPHPRDEVGFIRIPAPHPRDVVIENSYRM